MLWLLKVDRLGSSQLLATLADTTGLSFSVRSLPSEDPAQRHSDGYAELGRQ